MHPKYRFSFLLLLALFVLPCSLLAQNKVLLVFPEDDKFQIPYRFIKNNEKGTHDSVTMKFLTLKYLFYNELTQQLAQNNYVPIGGVNNEVNTLRKYEKAKWFAYDSIANEELPNKKYLAAKVDATNKNYYGLYATADSADYIVFINKVSVGANFFRKWLATKNYVMDIDFDIYDANMKHLHGRSIRKKVRLTKSTFWSAFQAHFAALPNALALYVINAKK